MPKMQWGEKGAGGRAEAETEATKRTIAKTLDSEQEEPDRTLARVKVHVPKTNYSRKKVRNKN